MRDVWCMRCSHHFTHRVKMPYAELWLQPTVPCRMAASPSLRHVLQMPAASPARYVLQMLAVPSIAASFSVKPHLSRTFVSLNA